MTSVDIGVGAIVELVIDLSGTVSVDGDSDDAVLGTRSTKRME